MHLHSASKLTTTAWRYQFREFNENIADCMDMLVTPHLENTTPYDLLVNMKMNTKQTQSNCLNNSFNVHAVAIIVTLVLSINTVLLSPCRWLENQLIHFKERRIGYSSSSWKRNTRGPYLTCMFPMHNYREFCSEIEWWSQGNWIQGIKI